ncbi:hypothetical protein [Spongiactinospora gelatinilytica]|uniref:hypothetical protein n=1 Tax=Spongiactinospora gelatinilytica TaxID=2666298 RepID=UPI001F1947FC|nr:hypothetical protein [Spongiactinospora gelatinilytica]
MAQAVESAETRLPATALVERVNEELGEGTVRRVKVQGRSAGRARAGGARHKRVE